MSHSCIRDAIRLCQKKERGVRQTDDYVALRWAAGFWIEENRG